jgi:hypothetical protein
MGAVGLKVGNLPLRKTTFRAHHQTQMRRLFSKIAVQTRRDKGVGRMEGHLVEEQQRTTTRPPV